MDFVARFALCLAVGGIASWVSPCNFAVAAVDATGRVTHVTVYRGQALVTRTIPLDGEPGSREIVVGDLRNR